MDSSTLLFIAIFFFVLGAGIVAMAWILIGLVRSIIHKDAGKDSKDPNLSVVASLMRDDTTKELVVQMDGKSYTSVSELSPKQLRRLAFTSDVLAKWLAQSPPTTNTLTENQPTLTTLTENQPAPTTLTENQPTPTTIFSPVEQASDTSFPEAAALIIAAEKSAPAESPIVVDTSPDMQNLDAPPAQSSPGNIDWIPAEYAQSSVVDNPGSPFLSEQSSEVKPVSTQIADMMSEILSPTPKPAPVYKSIAMQINDILQEKLAGTQFEKRGIIVSDGPDHGVLVSMDGQKYPGVKDVPDEEVRNLIRSAVLDWERQGKVSSK